MDVQDSRGYLRPAALLVVLLLHGMLILVLLRSKTVYGDRHASPQSSMTVFFISPQPRVTLAPSETPLTPHQAHDAFERQFLPVPPMPSTDPTSPITSQKSSDAPTIDWFAEAEKSATEIANRTEPGRAAEPSSPPTGSAPWDPHPHLWESTGHGLSIRIPVRIPGEMIDHCSFNMDLSQDQWGKREKYQVECALQKQPARGDLFDSLRKPLEPQR